MKLYIIGNGFDLHHGLNTSYKSFGLYLKSHYLEVYDLLLDHYGFEDLSPGNIQCKEPLWSKFETTLSFLDTETVLETNSGLLPDYSSDEFRDRDRYTFQIEMEMLLENLTTQLYKAFKEFILSVRFPQFDQSNAVNLDRDAMYLTFNYTDTLYQYYEIPDQNVLFIHEKAVFEGGDLILGHGVDPKNFEEDPEVQPKDLSEEDLERWFEFMSDQYDHSFELGKETIMRYFTDTFKGTDSIIEKNASFFNNLSNVNEVFVLGHSLADVDLPYFKTLVKSVNSDVKWTATYHDAEDKLKQFNTLSILGITNTSVVKMYQI